MCSCTPPTRRPPNTPAARELLLSWRRESLPWHVTWGIIYEFLRIATHPRVFERPWAIGQAWKFVDGIIASPGLSVLQETERHGEIAREVLVKSPPIAGNLVFDAHTAILMREHGITRIFTRDTAFHVFPFLAVVDPLA